MTGSENFTAPGATQEEQAHNNLMMVVATLTWVMLSCLTLLIYCCNYWQILRPHSRRNPEASEAQQSTLLSVED
uniref:Uncharacterized protein n=1 Tax=Drosophila melanogaster TaxID=7227 RepID=A0A0B4K7E8_DROME|nr:uncharacterized protein Dmel_CG43207 [Drosophila melanogaster]AFH08229.1 uncharacterized protein Dmel_CG43207 [Drosophila melanogaster]|eukprot:NP_001246476.1 uncharacterized protein Dmel_CG43207 [Drosophila melanogaster]